MQDPVTPKGRDLTFYVILVSLVVFALSTHARAGSANDRSRMAAVESLVHRGTWVIDESPFGDIVDRIIVDGHFYSDKPPVLTSAAAGAYAVIHRLFGLSLDPTWCDFADGPCHCRAACWGSGRVQVDWAYTMLTLLLVGLPAALTLGLFYRLARMVRLGNLSALALSGALGFATQLFPYATVFNSHVPAAASLLAGAYGLARALSGAVSRRGASRWLFLAGLATALASTMDLGVGLFYLAFLGLVLWRHRLRAWPYLAGSVLPFGWMVALDLRIVGTPLPPYFYVGGYDYPGSRFPQTVAGNRGPENVLTYGLRLLVGDHGFLALCPLLFWALVALLRSCQRRTAASDDLAGALGWLAPWMGVTGLLFVLYFIVSTDNFGGAAYGPRWYTVLVPLLFIFVALEWRAMAARWRWTLFLILLLLSLANAVPGALAPWRSRLPVLYLTHAGPEANEPLNAVLSGMAYEDASEDVLTLLEGRVVDKRWFDARLCLVIPPEPAWVFLGPAPPLDPLLAEGGGLGASSSSVVRYADLTAARDAWLARATTTAWVGAPESPPPVELPLTFGDQLDLLGFEILTAEVSPGSECALLSFWRARGRPGDGFAAFVHLLDAQGKIVGQVDGWGANGSALYPGDVVVHVHRLSVDQQATGGEYWLQIGLYDPLTMERWPIEGLRQRRLLLGRVVVDDE